MQQKWIQRLTLGLAATALFVAAGGPTYAASKINGSKLKTRSVSGSKLKNDTLSGTQIKESALGTVPKATAADSANSANAANTAINAGNADATDGVSEEAFTKVRVGTDTQCLNVSNAVFSDCVGVTIVLPRTQRVKVDVFTQWDSDDASGTSVSASCRIEQNGSPIGATVDPGTLSDDTAQADVAPAVPNYTRSLAVGTVTGALTAGTYTFNLACERQAGTDFDLSDMRTTAVALGSS